jgi:hypothetical protein
MRSQLRLWAMFLALFTSAAACTSPTVCAGVAAVGIDLVVRAPDGTNISRTTWVVVVSLVGSPPVPGDSMQGYHNLTLGSPVRWADDRPGTYLLRLRHDGYASRELTVVVPAGTNDCKGEVGTQHVDVTLTPL